jgi:hypothetical protein
MSVVLNRMPQHPGLRLCKSCHLYSNFCIIMYASVCMSVNIMSITFVMRSDVCYACVQELCHLCLQVRSHMQRSHEGIASCLQPLTLKERSDVRAVIDSGSSVKEVHSYMYSS